jgi:ribonucrease Y
MGFSTVTIVLVLVGGAAGAVGFLLWLRYRADRALRAARHESGRQIAGARSIAETIARDANITARTEALGVRDEIERAVRQREDEIRRLDERGQRMEQTLLARTEVLTARATEIDARRSTIDEKETAARTVRSEIAQADVAWREGLAKLAGQTVAEVRATIAESMIDDARARTAADLRTLEATRASELDRDARRVITTASERIVDHYLTERGLGVVHLLPAVLTRVAGEGEKNLRAIEEVAGIKLLPLETNDGLRLEGQDGIGREIARRTLAKLAQFSDGELTADTVPLARGIASELEREINDLGRRAFGRLKLELPHPEIVTLVGKLNWRTSYTQNQWHHAVEASYLAGMIAAELGLDAQLARRGALMHDIGKSLTHAIDGSHAVIGADIARRLGEAEVVANAIGSHHGEEPFNSPYAAIVTAADAMSGGRPGARRQQEESFGRRVEDLERLVRTVSGVDHAFALSGGREIRVFVRERQVDDAGCVRIATDLARKISDELVFPGQIKVTVIRETVVTESAG